MSGVALPAELHGLDFCYLSTAGRVSGAIHTIEIWFAVPSAGSPLYLLAGGGDGSDWVRNLRREPAVEVRVGARSWAGSARVIEDPEEGAVAARLVFEKYQPRSGGDLTGWRSSALPVAVDLGLGS